jgi:hypothetical protein
LIGDSGTWHWADLFLRPEPAILNPSPTRRRRWLVVYGGYAAFDSSPPAIMFVVRPAKIIVAPHFTAIVLKAAQNGLVELVQCLRFRHYA